MLLVGISVFAAEPPAPSVKLTSEQERFFETNIRPLLHEQCLPCHNDKVQSASLRLDSRQALLKGNPNGPVVVPGNPDQSKLLQVVHYQGQVKMPPSGKLKADQIAALTQWVRMGAPWPTARQGSPAAGSGASSAPIWSLRPVKVAGVPKVKNGTWVQNPIDAFVLAKLERQGLSPSPAADRRTLLRRISYDLTGLPPTEAELSAFVSDKSPQAYEKVVDRLLASPRYGERWGRHWLDVARYADTRGYNFVSDPVYHNAYTYRDWVIRAFNEDLPYDQFLIQQLAADLLPLGDDKRPLAALGFLTLGRRFLNDPVLIADDRIDTVTRGTLGLSVTCARCHDHKFDPISQKDYYALYGIFISTVEPDPPLPISEKAIREPYEAYIRQVKAAEDQRDGTIRAQVRRLRDIVAKTPDQLPQPVKDTLQSFRENEMPDANKLKVLEPQFEEAARNTLKSARERLAELQKSPPRTPEFAMALVDAPTPTEPRVFLRGNRHTPGEAVPRRFLAVLSGPEPKPFTKGSGRLELAQAIASKDNPLTARVMVNRIWQGHFGLGIVRTPSDFGSRGEPPTHPELLDWLAAEFIRNGWSVKKLHRLILLSNTYQQSVTHNPKAFARDPENRLLWRQNRQRLDLEALRDSLLFAAGRLDETMGGKSVDILATPYSTRRTVYGFIERQNLPGFFRTFDFASPDISTGRRYDTTVPQQSLYMMNSPFVIEQAKHLAALAQKSSPGPVVRDQKVQNPKSKIQSVDPRIRFLYRRLYGREPTTEEAAIGQHFVQRAVTPRPASAWQYGYGGFDEKTGRVVGFTPFPHFTGSAWQGGPNLPDPKLSWLTLSASGGHPGPGSDQMVIRRWTAPFDATLNIKGVLEHPEKQGNGVQGRIVSSREGVIGRWTVHRGKTGTNLDGVRVQKGDTLDFVVDSNGEISFDSFNWAPVLQAEKPQGPQTAALKTEAGEPKRATWDAAADFGVSSPSLTPWEQYAQALLMTNEFIFVD
jgi:hypothetical protein